jgi:uncharacterized protein
MIELVLAAALAASSAQDARPSFDCRRASSDAERAICADPQLARLDRRMAEAYRAVRARLSAPAREALARDQRWFIGARDEWQDNRERAGFRNFDDIAERMRNRIAFLDSIQTAPTSLIGSWRNAAGMVEVRPEGQGRVSVAINAANPVNARWLCDVSGTGTLTGDATAFTTDDGWRIRLVRRGAALQVEETPPPSGSSVRPYCGSNGQVGGVYLARR